MKKIVRIGTRESKLAVVQAQMVADAVMKSNPEIDAQLVTMKTTGDKILDKTLDKIGGKGLFVKELDEALSRGEVDICVHSYKDMPAEDNPEFPIVAVSEREDARDVFILPQGITSPDPDKPIGSSSARRQLQVNMLYKGHTVAPIRGNVLTRLKKLDSGEFSAIVLAYAGVKRLGLSDRISRIFEPDELLPAGCQGVLAVQGRAGEDYSYLSSFANADAYDTSEAERAFIRKLNCGCGAPAAVYGQITGDTLRLRGMLPDKDGLAFYDEISGKRGDAKALGEKLALIMAEKCGFNG